MFMGEFSQKMDAKGRIIVPFRFREGLGESFVVTKGVERCLYVYTNEEFDRVQKDVVRGTVPLTNMDMRKFNRFFLSGASVLEPDKMGRIPIPLTLRQHADLPEDSGCETTWLGVGDHVEIWLTDKWKKEVDDFFSNDNEEGMSKFEILAERIGGGGTADGV